MNRAFVTLLRPIFFLCLCFWLIPLSGQNDCAVSGGRLITANGTPYVPVCIDDMTEEVTVIERDGFSGENSVYFMTTAAGFIVQIMNGSPPYDFRELGAGVRAIWSVSYTGELTNAEIGDNICAAGATGCFNLSNPVVLNRATGEDCDVFCRADAGAISFLDGRVDTSICLISGVTAPLAITVNTPADAQNVNYLITSDQGKILDIVGNEGAFDFSNQGAGTCLIWQLAYADGLQGLELNNTPEDFQGCFSLSNPLTVIRRAVTAGSIFISAEDGGGTAISICTADGRPDPFGIDLYPGEGDNERWVITDANGIIVALPQDPPPYDLESAGVGRCRIYHLTHADGLTGLRPLANIADINGCYELSNPIIVTRRSGADCPDVFTAELSGNHLVPCPLTTSGYGQLRAALDGNVLTVTGSFSGLASDFNPNVGGGFQLHLGYAGQEGSFILPLTPQLNEDGRSGLLLIADNQLGLTNEQAERFLDRGLYVTLHTEAEPTGALRGQFLPEQRRYKYAPLGGAYAVPAEPTEAYGAVALERRGNQIVLSGSIWNLNGKLLSDTSGTAFLQGGITGRNGDQRFRLRLQPSADSLSALILPDSNTFVFSPTLLDSLDKDLLYINILTDFAPSGEIRGQLTDISVANFHADLSGQQARPEPVNTDGLGRLILSFNPDSSLTLSGSVADLSGTVTGTGLHLGLAGSIGPEIFSLNFSEDAAGGTWLPNQNTFELSPSLIRQLYGRELYVNVRTTNHPEGEVRGQILHQAAAYFGANLTGMNENPDFVDSEASGYVVFELCGEELVASGSFAGLESNFNAAVAGGANLHLGAAHLNGNAVLPLIAEVAADRRSGVFRATVNRMNFPLVGRNALDRSEIYVNLYSLEHPNGEIRGQVLGHRNNFPEAAEISSPRNGRNFTVFADGTTEQRGRFQPGTDPDGDMVVHAVEFAAISDADFAKPLLRQKIGNQAGSTTAILALHDTLRAQGFTTGMTAALRYRVLSSDGSVTTAGRPEIFTLVFDQVPDVCAVQGGQLSLAADGGNIVEFCTADGQADDFGINLDGNQGSRLVYVITDEDGYILRLTNQESYDFEGTGSGTSLLYALSFEAGVLGLAPGLLLEELQGCFALSNPIRIVRRSAEECGDVPCTADGGTLIISGSDSGTEITICSGDGEDDSFDVFLANNTGENIQYVVTDESGNIQAVTTERTFNFEGAGAGASRVYAISYFDGLLGLAPGLSLDNLQGCFALSNPIRVVRLPAADCGVDACVATGGNLQLPDGGTELNICAGDGRSDAFTLTVDDAEGSNLTYLLTDEQNRIFDLVADGRFDLEGAGPGISRIYALSYEDGILGLTVGSFTSDLAGCFGLSNAVTVIRQSGEECAVTGCQLDAGSLSLTTGGNQVTICVGDGEADTFEVVRGTSTGQYFSYVLTTEDGTIVSLYADPTFDFEESTPGLFLLYGMNFEAGLSGSLPGLNITDLQGCYALSDPITIQRLESGVDCDAPTCTATGGNLSLLEGGTETDVCVNDGVADVIRLLVNGNSGGGFTYLLTDAENNVLTISASPIFNLENTEVGTCRFYGLSFTSDLTGLVTGGNLADLEGCYGLTNPVTVQRNSGEDCQPVCSVNGGTLSVVGGGDQIAFCVGDDFADDFSVEISFQVGPNFLYVVTDTAGVIEAISANPDFDYTDAEVGISMIRGLSFGGDLAGAVIGQSIAGLSGCYALSNPVTVIRRPAVSCQVEIRPEVVITELNFFGAVEMTNIGREPIDIGTLYLGRKDDMRPVSSFMIGCGSLITKPGEVVTVFVGSLFDRQGGELALATTDEPALPSELLSYLAWGDNGERLLDEMATEAGYWRMDTELAPPNVISSIQLISDEDGREYGLRSPTPCASTGITTSIFTPRAAADMLTVYPNPFSDELMISVQGLRGQTTEVALFDATGRRVLSRTIHVRGGRFRMRTGQLAAGAYWLRLVSGGGVSTAQVRRF